MNLFWSAFWGILWFLLCLVPFAMPTLDVSWSKRLMAACVPFVAGLIWATYINRRTKSTGGIDSWNDALRREKNFSWNPRTPMSRSFTGSLALLLPQMSIDCLFEYLDNTSDTQAP